MAARDSGLAAALTSLLVVAGCESGTDSPSAESAAAPECDPTLPSSDSFLLTSSWECGGVSSVEWLLVVDVDWTDLTPLGCLCAVVHLELGDLPGLVAFDGLHDSSALEGVYVRDVPALQTLDPLGELPNLHTIGISGHTGFRDLAGLGPLTRLEGLYISEAWDLTSLRGLDNVEFIQEAELTVSSLRGLEGLTEVGTFEAHLTTWPAGLEGLRVGNRVVLWFEDSVIVSDLSPLEGFESGTLRLQGNYDADACTALGAHYEAEGRDVSLACM